LSTVAARPQSPSLSGAGSNETCRPHWTESIAEPQIVPAHALIVAVPVDMPTATPGLLTSLLIWATFVPDKSVELQNDRGQLLHINGAVVIERARSNELLRGHG
jgi:hypothetical protein